MNFKIFDGFTCLSQCGKQRNLVRYVGEILCDHVGPGWSGKSKVKARQFEKSNYRRQILRNFLMEVNHRMMFGPEPESWSEYLSVLADQIFKREMRTYRVGSRINISRSRILKFNAAVDEYAQNVTENVKNVKNFR